MTRRESPSPGLRASIAVLAIFMAFASLGRAQSPAVDPTASPAAAVEDAAPAIARAEKLLERLDPARPRDYFEAAESLMRLTTGDPSQVATLRRLTQETLVLSLELWRIGPARLDDARLGPSVLLALAALEPDPLSERARWLRVLAAAVDAQGLVSAAGIAADAPAQQSRDANVLDVLSALELLRAGEGRRASRLLERPEVFALLQAHERLLHPAGLTGEADRIRRLAADWPICVQCRNRRSVRDSSGVYLCPTCRGDPGPRFSTLEVLYQLRLEATLLAGAQQSWVSQTLVDAGRPLRDLDAAEVAPTLNVDPKRTIRRRGEWIEPQPQKTPPGRSLPAKPGADPPEADPSPAEQPVTPPSGQTAPSSARSGT